MRSAVHTLGERCFWDHRASDADLIAVAAPIVEKAHLLDPYTATYFHDYLDELAGGQTMADQVVRRWRAGFEAAPEPDVFDSFQRRKVHPDILAMFQPSDAVASDGASVIQALTFITAQNGWNPREEMILKGASINTFESIISEASIPQLQILMAKMLDIASNEDSYEKHFGTAGKNFVAACQKSLDGEHEGSRLARLIRGRFEEAGIAARLNQTSAGGGGASSTEAGG